VDHVASGDPETRRDLFGETAEIMGVEARIVEKDFWVCWTLKQLFSLPSYTDYFLFKGGTTLSKVFDVITRFSEDVDIAVNWDPLGFTGERSPTAPMSNTKRSKLLDEMLASCRTFIAEELKPALQGRFTQVLEQDWTLEVDLDDADALIFRYPKALSLGRSYVKEPVVLELGTHAELIPYGDHDICPYAATAFPHAFEQRLVRVRTIQAERTFWEKATILHAEHHRPLDKPTPARYARHYYDTVMLARSEHGPRALADLTLLARVVEHKRTFYPSGWARYDLAAPGSLKLVPPPERVAALRQDYASMGVMFFGPRPGFQELLDELQKIERTVNGSRPRSGPPRRGGGRRPRR